VLLFSRSAVDKGIEVMKQSSPKAEETASVKSGEGEDNGSSSMAVAAAAAGPSEPQKTPASAPDGLNMMMRIGGGGGGKAGGAKLRSSPSSTSSLFLLRNPQDLNHEQQPLPRSGTLIGTRGYYAALPTADSTPDKWHAA